MRLIVIFFFTFFCLTACYDPPAPLVVTTPKSVTTVAIQEKSLVITMHSDNSLSWYADNVTDSTSPVKISPASTEQIKKAIKTYKTSLGAAGEKMKIRIEGSDKADVNTFKTIIQALKELEIYKFSMITIPEKESK